ncbi:MAG: class I SAM-dependent rRNA methyltransferase [Geminicoccaceae bacterium]|nr:class I SAM-dependent rRNA methyltransferase [Geminicoccaceae bacterium]MDW8124469.1 class I SAM-dependent rRNA methyltransferase [Geminicoccaceae bacterium]
MSYPVIRILPGHDRRLRGGGPWLFSNEVQMDKTAKALEPGSLVRLVSHDGKAMALAQFNPHSLICARVLTRNTEAVIDARFFVRRLERALALRSRLFERPFYRLVHAEADGFPGVIVDRYGDVLVLQINTIGMQKMESLLLEALEQVLAPAAVVLRNDSAIRALEGLPEEVRVAKGTVPATIELEENGIVFAADVLKGQKTGWFYDQRSNRAFAAGLGRGQRVLDLYSYGGGFGLLALARGAREALLVDRAEGALALARESARRQGVVERCGFLRKEVFEACEELAAEKSRFGLVVADPPAFVKSRKDLAVGLRGYRKLARLAAGLVGEAGFLCIASCSHLVSEEDFAREVFAGIRAAGRGARLLFRGFAGPDHPVHPALPESAYLKFHAYALD